MPDKSLQPFELAGNEQKECDCVVCGRKSRDGGTEDVGSSRAALLFSPAISNNKLAKIIF